MGKYSRGKNHPTMGDRVSGALAGTGPSEIMRFGREVGGIHDGGRAAGIRAMSGPGGAIDRARGEGASEEEILRLLGLLRDIMGHPGRGY
jgi:hypothetical protein